MLPSKILERIYLDIKRLTTRGQPLFFGGGGSKIKKFYYCNIPLKGEIVSFFFLALKILTILMRRKMMRKSIFIKLLAVLFAFPLFVSCHDDNKVEPPVIDTEEPKLISDHTLVFYIMGNGTGLTPTMDLGLNSIRSAASKVVSETNHVVVFYDRGDVTRLYELVDVNGAMKEQEIRKYVSTDNCVDPQFMADVFKLIDETFSSDSYGVVFSSHGGGWASTNTFNEFIAETFPASESSEPQMTPLYCGQDGLIYMDIPEMADALDRSGLSFDYILFDACYMSSIEAIYDLRYFADYIIASPCEVLAGGFPYKEIIPMLFTEGHQLENVCKSYVDYYRAQTGDKQSAVIALTDCAELETLAEEVRKVNASGGSYNVDGIQAYEGFSSHLFFDLEQLLPCPYKREPYRRVQGRSEGRRPIFGTY